MVAVDLLRAWHNPRGAAKINSDEFRLDPGDCTGDNSADLIFESREYGIVFGFTKALNDDLFSGLSSNATELGNFMFLRNLK